MGKRDPGGRFAPGQSGNPGGRPRRLSDLREALQEHAPTARDRLVKLAKSADERVALAAVREILDRLYGRPVQAIEASGPNGGPIEHDLSSLTDDELETVVALLRKAQGDGAHHE